MGKNYGASTNIILFSFIVIEYILDWILDSNGNNGEKKKTPTKKKKTPTKKKKKNDKEPLPPPKLKNADDDTVVTHGDYSCYTPYAYQVQSYNNKPQAEYTPFDLTDQFLPKFKLPYGVVPSVDAICLLSLPDLLIDGIVEWSNVYAMAQTNVSPTIVEEDKIKKNPCYMHPSKFRTLTRQDILYFFASYYYFGYCRLPAKQDYWAQHQRNSCLPSHWMDGVFF